jgi:hypothetical protein
MASLISTLLWLLILTGTLICKRGHLNRLGALSVGMFYILVAFRCLSAIFVQSLNDPALSSLIMQSLSSFLQNTSFFLLYFLIFE